MITLRRAEERHHDQRRKQQVWQTFAPRDRAGLPTGGFGILDGALEVKRFAAALRHNELCTVASTDGRKGSLCILQNALIMSSGLDPGHHIVHELIPGRSAWVHVICGETTLDNLVLTQGDGVGVTHLRGCIHGGDSSSSIRL